MNIPEAIVFATITLEPATGGSTKAKLFVIEDEPGLWLLVRRSKRTTTKASEPANRIAVFPTGDDELTFGEFMPADNNDELHLLLFKCGLSLRVHNTEKKDEEEKPAAKK